MKAFKVNADYEVELFHKQLAPPAINQSIEFFLFFLNESPLYSQKSYSTEYLKYVEELTGHKPIVLSSGPFDNFWGPLKNKEIEKWWNSKITSTELMIQKKWCADTYIIKSEADLPTINWHRDLLVKDPFGMSGQKFQLLRHDTPLAERQVTLLKALKHGSLIVEPWFNRKFDFSQYLFPNGKLIAYQNQVDDKFQYKGTVFNNYQSARLEELSFYSQISEGSWAIFRQQTQAIIDFYSQYPNEYGYSIDSFVYEENGQLKIRVMSEINYRRTMGRTAFELSEKYAADKKWTALLMTKNSGTIPLWQLLTGVAGVMVLSPGDSRFEIIFLSADNREQGFHLIQQINKLLPDAQFTVKL